MSNNINMVRYSEELIEEIKNRNDIVDVISQYVVLKRSGRSFFGLCPFHKEKSPSFSVSPDKQIFHCFGCGVGGNVIHFVSKLENLSFRDTLEVLAERSGIELPTIQDGVDAKKENLKTKVYEINKIAAEFYHNNLYLPTSKPAQEYVKKRRLDNTTLKNFMIGYSGNFNELYTILSKKGFTEEEILASSLVNKNPEGKFIDRFRKRLMFPIQDVRGRVIAFGGRVLDDSKPKYINSPENIVYSKGRHLYGLNVAKKAQNRMEKIIIVEGYMDAVSLHQRGIHNVVASLGTALTEAQGHLLRNNSSQVIIGYDADGAGQAATMRGLEILQNMGCDLRILQIEGAKDPDEYVVKYGPERFLKQVEKSISLVEYKVKILKNTLDLDNANDKIRFLKEIAKVLSKIDSMVEQEVYIDKLSKDYNISKQAIIAEINKLIYRSSDSKQGAKVLEKSKPKIEENINKEPEDKKEKLIIYLLINYPNESYEKLKQNIQIDSLKSDINRSIIKKLYEEIEKGNSNITNNIIDFFEEEEKINYLSSIMADNFEITEVDKCIEDVINSYSKERLLIRKNELVQALKEKDLGAENAKELEKELIDIVTKLSKIK